MEVSADLSNIPKPHIIFSASAYKVGDDWAVSEREQWLSNVIVSFQENTWVVRKGFKYEVSKMLQEINKRLEEKGESGVLFADNLSTHKSEESLLRSNILRKTVFSKITWKKYLTFVSYT